MANERWRHVEQVFGEVVSLPTEAREARLEELCLGDAELKASVESLLAHSDDTGAQHSTDVRASIERVATDFVESRSPPGIGRRVGPWHLQSLIARGGMGAVYLAERADGQFEQRAAVKLINHAALSPEAMQRFNSERQILAHLDHPNVARLIDGGTADDGVPWLAMEFIDGLRIDAYCDRERLGLRARLELFRKVCGAVQYAHRNLVVHRDIKPSNILVDSRGEPKLLDFGVAKLFGATRRELTVTVADKRVLTPRYSSPEQLRGLPLTTATDIYSLAVLLYELLVGSDPYGPSASEPVSLHRAICETEPEQPSSAARHTRRDAGISISSKRLQGDLDNIVLMGLRKEAERRYSSAQQLSDDIGRYLNDEPVIARPDTFAYRSAKFLKRRRVPIFVASSAALLLAVVSALFVNRIVLERDAAEAARANAEQMTQFLQEMLRGADRFANAGEEVTLRNVLDSGAAQVRTELVDQPIEQARLMQTMADSYHALSLFEPAMEYTQLALELRRRELGPAHVETLQSLREYGGLIYLTGGDTEAALVQLEQARDLQIAALGSASGELVPTYYEIAVVQRVLGKPREALTSLRAGRAVLNRLPPEHGEQRNEAMFANQIGNALDNMGDRAGALEAYRESLELFVASEQSEHPAVGSLQHNIGLTLRAQGKLEEALPYLRRAIEHTRRTLGEQSEDYEVQLGSLGRTLAQLSRFDEASEYVEAALEVAEGLYGPNHQYYAYNLVNVARLRQLEGRHGEAVEVLERAVAIYREAFGSYHRFLAAAEVGLADSYIEIQQFGQAEELVAGTLVRMHEDPQYEQQVEALGRSVHGRALGWLGRVDEARPLLTASVADLRELLGDAHQLTAQAAGNAVRFLERENDNAAADEYRALLEMR